jgi:hypothetical protein
VRILEKVPVKSKHKLQKKEQSSFLFPVLTLLIFCVIVVVTFTIIESSPKNWKVWEYIGFFFSVQFFFIWWARQREKKKEIKAMMKKYRREERMNKRTPPF